jgi:lipopolysaccharide export system protein LptA
MTKRKKLLILVGLLLLVLSGAYSYFDGLALIKPFLTSKSGISETITKLSEGRTWTVSTKVESSEEDKNYVSIKGSTITFNYPNKTFIEIKAKNARYSKNQRVLFMPDEFEININNQFKTTSRKADLFIQQQLISGREAVEFTANNMKISGVGFEARLKNHLYTIKDKATAELTTTTNKALTITANKTSIFSLNKNIVFQHEAKVFESSKTFDGSSETLTANYDQDFKVKLLDFGIGAKVRVKKLTAETEKAAIDFALNRLSVLGEAKVKISKKSYEVASLTYDYNKKKIKLKRKKKSRKSKKK